MADTRWSEGENKIIQKDATPNALWSLGESFLLYEADEDTPTPGTLPDGLRTIGIF